MEIQTSRYELVSRRALLKASAGIGAALVLPSCGNDDVNIFAGAVADPAPSQLSAPQEVPAEQAAVEHVTKATPLPEETPTPLPEETPTPAPSPTAPPPTPTALPTTAIDGELVISFTYTQAVGGKNERPYVAVWLEDEAGDLIETVALWYQQRRRGERWLDHLDRWWDRDQARIASGGSDVTAVISSATRQAGSFAVAWDGTIDGVTAPPGRYFVCVESAREKGPYSLVRAEFDLAGSLRETPLPDNGELSGVTVRTSV